MIYDFIPASVKNDEKEFDLVKNCQLALQGLNYDL
jgi:hypothetical protein